MTYDDDTIQAIQAVADRVSSYQDGAPEGTVEKELDKALGEAGVELEGGDVTKLADAIEAEGGKIQVSQVLG